MERRHEGDTKLGLYMLYLPLNRNDGSPQPRERLEWALEQVARFAGGYTLLPPSDGAWVDGRDHIRFDRVLPVLVIAPRGPEGWAFFARLARILAQVLEQEEIFIHATEAMVVGPPDPAITQQDTTGNSVDVAGFARANR